MEEKDLVFKMVQAQIGYTFRNLDLLQQAFTRRSYSEENGGENNEILEFIGDKALDFAVVKILVEKYGKMKNCAPAEIWRQGWMDSCKGDNTFVCDCSEDELTKLKSRMVQKKTLSKRMDEMGFAPHLIMGNGDIKNDVLDEASVKEDLFEAIVGAVAIDSGWNFSVLQSVVEAMLLPEDFIENDIDDNYVRLIQDWEMEENHVIPWFWFKEQSYQSMWYDNSFDGISQSIPFNYNIDRLIICELKLLNDLPIFRGFGASKSEARMNVCKLAYEYLEKEGYISEGTMREEIDEPTKEAAINQLEILASRGYFSKPTYVFEENYDKNGNPVWQCSCTIAEYDEVFKNEASSKKEAKKMSALNMLEYVLDD